MREEWNYTPDVGLGEHGRHTPLPTIKGGSNRDADEMMRFLVDCHPEAVQIRESNP
ncbi:hypothetical protein [Trinickia dinghuensis]|uniref:hypothetical protein n=1 Tax=Trinickia dinghuensis TaxID=2291023 RepID=UPI0015F194D4|nr:hypothetical protein [Trinickia dinghuensis]